MCEGNGVVVYPCVSVSSFSLSNSYSSAQRCSIQVSSCTCNNCNKSVRYWSSRIFQPTNLLCGFLSQAINLAMLSWCSMYVP